MPSTTLPTWLALTSVIAAPVVSVFVAYLTVTKTHTTERERLAQQEKLEEQKLAHQEKMEEQKLQHVRWDEERKDRLQVYRTMAKVTRNSADFDAVPESKDLDETLAEIELITESEELVEAAAAFKAATADARIAVFKYRARRKAQVVDPKQDKAVDEAVKKAERLRGRFIEEA